MPEEPFVFDPKMFITGPLHPCPQCGSVEIGTLSITNNVHTRRCRNCFHDERERLPPLDKKLIYLDQMVLSNIAKELDPVWREETRRRDEYWMEAFDRIDRLIRLQLIVCPDSPIHEIESSYLEQHEAELRRLYKHLASGVRLRFHHEVLMAQLSEALEAWLTDRDPDWSRIAREHVVRGDLDRWSERWRVTVNMGYWLDQIDSRRESRDLAHEKFQQRWERWASEGHVSFEARFEEERRGVAVAALQSFKTHFERLHEATTGTGAGAVLMQLMQPAWPVRLVSWLLNRLEERGVAREDQLQRAADFLNSEEALSAPENHLGALLFAGLARRAASGQKRVPSRGTPNDIRFVAAYLPYCHAMFIDNEFAQLLKEEPLATAVKDYSTEIFSASSRDGFLDYLARLEAEAEPSHVDLVDRTYGETWTVPYRSMLEHERSKRARDRS